MESKAVDGRRHNFTIIDNEVIKRTAEIGIYALSVYAVLAQMANAQGKCFPGQRYIADTLGISERKVRSSIESLEKANLIRVSHRNGFHSEYTILPVKKDTPAQHTALPRHDMPETPAPHAGEPRHHMPPNKTNVIRQEEQDAHPGERATLSIQDQTLLPIFNQIVTALGESDLDPLHSRLAILRKAMANIGTENVIKAANNLARSSEVDLHKTYDWLFNKWDYQERITKFMTRKAAGITHTVAPDRAPDGWRLPQ